MPVAVRRRHAALSVLWLRFPLIFFLLFACVMGRIIYGLCFFTTFGPLDCPCVRDFSSRALVSDPKENIELNEQHI